MTNNQMVSGILYREELNGKDYVSEWKNIINLSVEERITNRLYVDIVKALRLAIHDAIKAFKDNSTYGAMIWNGFNRQ